MACEDTIEQPLAKAMTDIKSFRLDNDRYIFSDGERKDRIVFRKA